MLHAFGSVMVVIQQHLLDFDKCGLILLFFARKQLLLSARLSHRNSAVCLSACLSVTQVDQSKMVQARYTKSSAAWKTLVSGTVKLFHKFEEGHPERGH